MDRVFPITSARTPWRVVPRSVLEARTVEIELSVVIPLTNEAGSLRELHRQLAEVLDELDVTYELIFVDDGSRDQSPLILGELATLDPNVVVLTHRHNRGKADALSTGFAAARGEVILTIDADLQDDPYEIPHFLGALSGGYDMISGWKSRRQDPWPKRVQSRVFNMLTRAASGLPLHDINCGFKAYRRQVIEELDLYGDMHRLIPIIAANKGYRVGEIEVRHHPRRWGSSKYGWTRIPRGFLDLITVAYLARFAHRPLHFFGGLGLLTSFSGSVILVYLAAQKLLLAETLSDRPLLLLGILLVMLGVQFLTMGLIGEMMVRNQLELYRVLERRTQDDQTDMGYRTRAQDSLSVGELR